MAGCLPERLRGLFGGNGRKLRIMIAGDTATFEQVKGKAVQPLGTLDLLRPGLAGADERAREILSTARLAGCEVVIGLPRDSSLRRIVDLPSPALENLREVLSFEMDRHTPFRSDEVSFDCCVAAHDTQNKRIKVDLVVVAKDLADRAIGLATGWGVEPDRLAVAGSPDEEESFNLLPAKVAGGRSRMALGLTGLLVLVPAVALALAVYLPLKQRQAALEDVEALLRQVRQEATESDKLNRQFEEITKRSRFVQWKKGNVFTATELLNEVTKILPDDTWLLQFARKGNNMTISGYSEKPPALIGLLEESDMLSKVSFRSPTTNDPKVGRVRFNIAATVHRRSET
ncbi:MAG: PilN domain-containing protein [Planctomycetota bacterium]